MPHPHPSTTAGTTSQRRKDAARALAIAAGALPALAAATHAQDTTHTPPTPPISSPATPAFSGRTLAGTDLNAPVTNHPVTLAAVRATAWDEGPQAAPTTTSRLLLEGDVSINIGPFSFNAARAAVWIEPINLLRTAADGSRTTTPAEQIAVYLEDTRAAPTRSPAAPNTAQNASRLLVTAITTNTGPTLRADDFIQGRPTFGQPLELNTRAEQRLASHLATLTKRTDRTATPRPSATTGFNFADENFTDTRTNPPEPTPSTILTPKRGTVTFRAPNITAVDDGQGATAILLTAPNENGIGLEFIPADRRGSARLEAQRAVVFLAEPLPLAGAASLDASDIEGIYLEGDVNLVTLLGNPARADAATDHYHLRGSRLFYNPSTERALVIDAVFWTYDEERGMPLYLRAEQIRQTSSEEWNASNATLANAAFAEPHFAVGATDITLSRKQRPDGTTTEAITAKGVTFNAAGLPLFYLPSVSGEFKPSPLRSVNVESEDGDPIVRTEWDLYNILGIDAGPTNTAALLLDAYTERGPGIGTDIAWDTRASQGNIFAYYIRDDGTDRLTTGARIDRDRENRGLLLAETIWQPSELWTIHAEAATISDPAFLDAFFEEIAEEGRELATGIRATRRTRNDQTALLTLEARASLDDFVANEYLLQSRGFQTERLPEITWQQIGQNLADNNLLYFGESRFGVVSLDFAENRLEEQGFRTQSLVTNAFGPGLTPQDSLESALRAQGLPDGNVTRFDSRHEIALPLELGPVQITPYTAGRFTAYDDDFEQLSTDGRGIEDNSRLWAAVGLRAATAIHTVDNGARSETLDIDRLRHIIEPSLHLWHADASESQTSLPTYDEGVESLAEHSAAKLGLRNTWQTKRGTPGRKRSVDWLTIDTNLVLASEDAQPESPINRFNDRRPEESFLGNDHLELAAVLRATDAVTVIAESQYDADDDRFPFTTTGLRLDHGFGHSSFIEYRAVDTPNLDRLATGLRYELTRKYAAEVEAAWDLNNDDVQSIGASVQRRFPQWTLTFDLDFDETRDTVNLGLALRPVGFGGEDRTRVFTQEFTKANRTAPAQPNTRYSTSRLSAGPFED